MNNKGQSLVVFVIIIPLIFIFGVFVFDLAKVYSEKTKLDNVAYDALYYKFTSHQSTSKAKSLVMSNDSSIKIDVFTENTICLSKDTEPLFGSAVGYEKYTIKTCYVAKVNSGILGIEKKGD